MKSSRDAGRYDEEERVHIAPAIREAYHQEVGARKVVDLRLLGLTGQSSILWMMAGFVALLILGNIRDNGLTLAGHGRTKEVHMKKAKKALRVLVFNAANITWAIGASVMAVPLSA